MEFSAAKKIILTAFIIFEIPFVSFAFICVEPSQRYPYNILAGNILKIDEPERRFPVPLNTIRIVIEGTNFFTMTNAEGYFYFSNIEIKKIRLRFEYMDSQAYYDLGEIDLNHQILLKDITLSHGKVNVGLKEIKPFQTLETTGTVK